MSLHCSKYRAIPLNRKIPTVAPHSQTSSVNVWTGTWFISAGLWTKSSGEGLNDTITKKKANSPAMRISLCTLRENLASIIGRCWTKYILDFLTFLGGVTITLSRQAEKKGIISWAPNFKKIRFGNSTSLFPFKKWWLFQFLLFFQPPVCLRFSSASSVVSCKSWRGEKSLDQMAIHILLQHSTSRKFNFLKVHYLFSSLK